MEEKHESNSVSTLRYRIIWCTKFRHPILVEAVEVELRHILYQTCITYGWSLVELEIMPDHVNLFIQASPADAPSNIATTLKNISAVHLFNRFPKLRGQKFWGTGLWSSSTYCGTVGEVSENIVRKYVQEQKTKGQNCE